MAKHLDVRIEDGVLEFRRDEDSIRREADLDGIYVLRRRPTTCSVCSQNRRTLSPE